MEWWMEMMYVLHVNICMYLYVQKVAAIWLQTTFLYPFCFLPLPGHFQKPKTLHEGELNSGLEIEEIK